MSSSYGETIRFTLFGQSHGPVVGVTMEGVPPGFPIDLEALQAFLNRRAPGRSPTATARREEDRPEFLSGLVGNVTCGAPLTAVIPNRDIHPQDYRSFRDCPRPGHGDYTAQAKFHGTQDAAGGGHLSGRLTAPLCIAGGICLQLLAREGVTIAAHIQAIGDQEDLPFDPVAVGEAELQTLLARPFPVLRESAEAAMTQTILEAKAAGDSVGGVIECAALGLQPGWGDPIFGGMENRIAQAVFGIPGVRGVEFGAGFSAARLRGSEHNDAFCLEDGQVRTKTNRHGGILGGITSGMPLLFRVAIKPTPSISRPQESISMSRREPVTLEIPGRHDPCIVPRAVPCVEAAAAVAKYDAYLQGKKGD